MRKKINNPDDVMLKKNRKRQTHNPLMHRLDRPLTKEELEALGSQPKRDSGISPYVRIVSRNGKCVEVGIKGTF